MAMVYEYNARENGKRVKGTQRAETPQEAAEILNRRGLFVFKLRERATPPFSFRKMVRSMLAPDLPDRITFFRGYAALESQGVPFNEAFDLLAREIPTGPLHEAVVSVRSTVSAGQRLSVAMAERPEEFSPIEIAMIAAGEESKGRAEILDRLATFLERDAKLRKRLSGALTYPGIVLVAAFMLMLYAAFWLLPIFAGLYANFNVPIPTAMSVVLSATAAVKQPLTWLIAIVVICGAGVTFNRYVSTEHGAYKLDKTILSDGKLFSLKLWPFGEIRRKAIVSRVARALSALLESGVDLKKALDTVTPITESPVFAQAFQRARETLAQGNAVSLTDALRMHDAMDRRAIGFVEIGERVSQVPEMLRKIADYYDDDIESKLQSLPEKIQVLVTIMLGVVVAYLGYIVYVPLATLSTSIH